MANWIRRSPQNPECVVSPQAPGCGGQEATQTVPPTIDGLPTGTAETTGGTEVFLQSTASNAEVFTTVITNDDGSFYTTVSTIFPTTTAAATPTTLILPSVVAEAPEGAQATSKSSNNDGVSKGAVAGIAIGTCIVGAAIAFVVAWLLFKRQDRKFVQKTCPSGYPIYADSSPELVMVQKSAATGSPYVQVSQTHMRTPVPVPARTPAAVSPQGVSDALAGILPHNASEHDVQNRVLVLFGQIHRHVDTYYRDVHASITPSMDSDLASFGKDVDMLELLQNCSSPTVALKHALMVFVLSTTEPKSEGTEQTLWPDELASVLRQDQNLPSSESSQLSTAQALHRRLTVYLYTRANALTPQNRSQSRLSNLSAFSLTRKMSSTIREAAEHFSLTFFPWANPTFGDQERESDLAGIIGEVLECRIWLCGQMGEWGFEWEVPGRGAVVVAPALVLREDGRGPRRVVLDQSLVGI